MDIASGCLNKLAKVQLVILYEIILFLIRYECFTKKIWAYLTVRMSGTFTFALAPVNFAIDLYHFAVVAPESRLASTSVWLIVSTLNILTFTVVFTDVSVVLTELKIYNVC